jgi:hypothetical protein
MAKTKRRRQTLKRKKMRGGSSTFSVPIRAFYPQNMLNVDPQRAMVQTGGGRKYSRKYLIRGGSSFLSSFPGPLNIYNSTSNQNITPSLSTKFMI